MDSTSLLYLWQDYIVRKCKKTGFAGLYSIMEKKYPIGLQSFLQIREGGFVYVDKTEKIHRMIESGKYYFISRPHHWGKSLLLDTISNLFTGNRDLFKDLWIYDKWDWQQQDPVIRLSFSRVNNDTVDLEKSIIKEVMDIADRLNVPLIHNSYDQLFKQLITGASKNGRVIILIDEYDNSCIDYLDDTPKSDANRTILKNFYSVLKDADEHLRLLIVTGVSRFGKINTFPELDHLEDITLSKHFNSLMGITQQELEKNFKEELDAMSTVFGMSKAQLLKAIKEWYGGYSWDAKEILYNPFSLLSFLKEQSFKNFWPATATASFLAPFYKEKKGYDFENIRETDISLGSFQAEGSMSASMLFQAGYLTIKSYDANTQLYSLDCPNREIRNL